METNASLPALKLAAARLADVSRQPARDAFLLLQHVLGRDRASLLAHPEDRLSLEQMEHYDRLVNRRVRHEPMQYILGEQEFYGLPLRVTPAVLIPRPETEHLVEAVLGCVPHDRPLRVADVGTGSGAIALALATYLPLAALDALDLSTEALVVAEGNARSLGLAHRVRFLPSDLLASAGDELYDCVVSNPPYVSSGEELEPQVGLWEPPMALFAGPDGLAVYRRLLPQAAERLAAGGLLALEMGAGQQQALESLFAAADVWQEPVFLPDLRGIARVALARRR